MVLIAGQCSESQLVFQFEKSYAVLSKSGIPLLPFQLLSNYFSSDTSNCFNPRARTGLGFASKTYKQEAEELFDVLEKVHNMLKK